MASANEMNCAYVKLCESDDTNVCSTDTRTMSGNDAMATIASSQINTGCTLRATVTGDNFLLARGQCENDCNDCPSCAGYAIKQQAGTNYDCRLYTDDFYATVTTLSLSDATVHAQVGTDQDWAVVINKRHSQCVRAATDGCVWVKLKSDAVLPAPDACAITGDAPFTASECRTKCQNCDTCYGFVFGADYDANEAEKCYLYGKTALDNLFEPTDVNWLGLDTSDCSPGYKAQDAGWYRDSTVRVKVNTDPVTNLEEFQVQLLVRHPLPICTDYCAGVTCTASDDCHSVGTCDATTGVCSDPLKADDAVCDDGDASTGNDKCTAGTCAGVDLCAGVTCDQNDQCHDAGSCDPSTGNCVYPDKADDTVCDDTDAATTDDKCTAGVCAGIDKCAGVSCKASDVCHTAGECDKATGQCSNPNAADDTTCDDGDDDTNNDVCTAGVCAGENKCAGVTCLASDTCHTAGVCDSATGKCSNPEKADDSTCDDGDDGTGGDVCTAGVCAGEVISTTTPAVELGPTAATITAKVSFSTLPSFEIDNSFCEIAAKQASVSVSGIKCSKEAARRHKLRKLLASNFRITAEFPEDSSGLDKLKEDGFADTLKAAMQADSNFKNASSITVAIEFVEDDTTTEAPKKVVDEEKVKENDEALGEDKEDKALQEGGTIGAGVIAAIVVSVLLLAGGGVAFYMHTAKNKNPKSKGGNKLMVNPKDGGQHSRMQDNISRGKLMRQQSAKGDVHAINGLAEELRKMRMELQDMKHQAANEKQVVNEKNAVESDLQRMIKEHELEVAKLEKGLDDDKLKHREQLEKHRKAREQKAMEKREAKKKRASNISPAPGATSGSPKSQGALPPLV